MFTEWWRLCHPWRGAEGLSYFNGEISDGNLLSHQYRDTTVCVGLVCFFFLSKGVRVLWLFWIVRWRNNDRGEELEFHTDKKSRVVKSDKTFEISENLPTKYGREMAIGNLQHMACFPEGHWSGRGRWDLWWQDEIGVCDATRSAHLTIKLIYERTKLGRWKSYRLSEMVVRECCGQKVLSHCWKVCRWCVQWHVSDQQLKCWFILIMKTCPFFRARGRLFYTGKCWGWQRFWCYVREGWHHSMVRG